MGNVDCILQVQGMFHLRTHVNAVEETFCSGYTVQGIFWLVDEMFAAQGRLILRVSSRGSIKHKPSIIFVRSQKTISVVSVRGEPS